MRAGKHLLIVAAALVTAAPPLHTQAEPRTGDLRGRVVERADSAVGVVTAEVELAGIVTRSDQSGHFSFREVPAGEHELRVRRLGFHSVTRRVIVACAAIAIWTSSY